MGGQTSVSHTENLLKHKCMSKGASATEKPHRKVYKRENSQQLTRHVCNNVVFELHTVDGSSALVFTRDTKASD